MGWDEPDNYHVVSGHFQRNNTLNQFHYPNVAKMTKKNFSAFRKLEKKHTIEEVASKSHIAVKLWDWATHVEEIFKLQFTQEYQVYKTRKFDAVVTEPNNKMRKLRARLEKITINKM